MKLKFIMFILLLIVCSATCSLIQNGMPDEYRYGQKSPGTTPEPYQPKSSFLEIGATDFVEFSPDGKELCYTKNDTTTNQRTIYYMHKEKGSWTKPEIAYFVPNHGEGGLPQFSPEGNRFSFTYKGDLWSSVKKSGQWSVAEKLPAPVCSDEYECGFSFARSGAIYFASSGRPEGKGHCDIYCSKTAHNQFLSTQHLTNLNTDQSECVLSVSPDEKYIVFTRFLLKEGQNAVDLYISFHQKEDTWTLAQKLGPEFNSPGSNHSPRFSTDGKYFFFSQAFRTDTGAIENNNYWVSTRIFDEMRDSVLSAL
jgi:Tol biopolymer transport system component